MFKKILQESPFVPKIHLITLKEIQLNYFLKKKKWT